MAVEIIALLAGKHPGAAWLDPLMGVLGAILVVRWAAGLLRQRGRVLLDRRAPPGLLRSIVYAITADGDNRIYDLHVWAIGPGCYAAEIAIETGDPRHPDHYRDLLPQDLGLRHVTVEVAPSPKRPD